MMGFDDAAGMGMGMLNSVAQIPFQIKQGQLQKKQRQLGQKQATQDFQQKQAEISDEKRSMNRQTTLGEQRSQDQTADRGLQNSSIPNDNNANAEWERGLRNQALDRRSNYNANSFSNEQQGWKYQRQQQRTQYYSSMLSNMLQQGGQGAMSSIGGGQ